MWPLNLVLVTTSSLATATACAHDPGPVGHGQNSTQASPAVISLRPNDHGYVRIETLSNSVGCSITAELIACQRFSGVWRDASGLTQHTFSVSTGGQLHWVAADLGELQGRVPLGLHTYGAQGWTIVAQPADTRFVNDYSGHGMTVDAERVTPY